MSWELEPLVADNNALSQVAEFFGAEGSGGTPKTYGRDSVWNYIQTKLATIALTGNASNLTGINNLPAGVLPVTLQDIATANWTQGSLAYYNGGHITPLGLGTSGQVLQTGATNNLQWVTLSALAFSGNAANLTGTLNTSLFPAAVQDLANVTPGTGDLFYYGSGGHWLNLGMTAPSGQVLTSNGVHQVPTWQAIGGTLGQLAALALSQGDVLYFNGSTLTNLSAGTSGQYLMTQGPGQNPKWAPATAGGLVIGNNLSELTATAGTARANISAANSKANGQTDFISGLIPTPTNQAYELVVNIPFGCTITKTSTICTAGSCTATWSSGGVNLGSTNSVSTTLAAIAQSTNNVITSGNDITVTISANSSCANLSFTIAYTYQLAA